MGEMKRYVLQFAGAWVLFTILVAIVATVLDFKGGAWIGVATVLAASAFAADRFAKEARRDPSPVELRTFSRWALGAILALSFIVCAILLVAVAKPADYRLLGSALVSPIIMPVVVAVLAVMSVVYFFAIKWSFSWYVKLTLKGQARSGQLT
jgi:hypothetical protein